jgi:hypothetical protein
MVWFCFEGHFNIIMSVPGETLINLERRKCKLFTYVNFEHFADRLQPFKQVISYVSIV